MSAFAQLCYVAQVNPPLDAACLAEEEVAFLPMAGVNETQSIATPVERRAPDEVRKGYTPFRSGDVLVAKITPCFENGKVAQVRTTTAFGFGSTEFHVVRPNDQLLDARYLVHFLRQPSIRAAGERRMTGSAGQRRVPQHFLEELAIPTPPLAEQRRIAAILDQAAALCAKRREARKRVSEVAAAAFHERFRLAPEARLGDVIRLRSGDFLPASQFEPSGEVPVYGGNGVAGYHSEANVQKPSVIIGRVGVYCGVVHKIPANSWVTDNALIADFDRSSAEPQFVAATLRYAQLNRLANQAAQPLVTASRLAAARIKWVDVAAQRAFGLFVAGVDRLSTEMEAADLSIETLFSNLQHRAFRGEL